MRRARRGGAREEQPWEAADRRRCLLEALDDEDFRRGLNDLTLLLLRGPTWLQASWAASKLAKLAFDRGLAIAKLWGDNTARVLLEYAQNWVRLNAGQPQIDNPFGLSPLRKARPRSDVPITKDGTELRMPVGDRGEVLRWLDVLKQFERAGQEPTPPGHPKGQPKPSGSGRRSRPAEESFAAERLSWHEHARLYRPELDLFTERGRQAAREHWRAERKRARRLRGKEV